MTAKGRGSLVRLGTSRRRANRVLTQVASVQGQFFPFFYPSPGHVPVRMLYKYGSQLFGTMVNGNRWVKAYQHPSLEFIVNQSVWKEGETPYCDVILPKCTVFEKGTSASGTTWAPGACITCTR